MGEKIQFLNLWSNFKRCSCFVRMEEGRSAFEILTRKPIGKGPVGRQFWNGP